MSPNTFEALIERLQVKANVFSSSDRAHTVFNVCADELAALAPHYISKDKVLELRDWCEYQELDFEKNTILERQLASKFKARLLALLGKEGE